MSIRNTLLHLTALAAVASIATLPAAAGDGPWSVEIKSGTAEVEGTLGSRHLKFLDSDDGALALALGYRVNRYLSVQAGYSDLGDQGGFGSPCSEADEFCIESLALCVEGTECTLVAVPIDADLTGFSLAALPTWPVSDRFSIFGKVGVMSWESEASSPSFGRIDSYSGEDLILGVGLRYEFPGGLGVVVEHEEFDFDATTTVIGASWRF